MTSARGRVAVALMVLIIAITGCADQEPRVVAGPFPPRPADLRVADLDPCATLNTEQRRALDVSGPGIGAERTGVPTCTFRASGQRSWTVAAMAGVPATAFSPGTVDNQGAQLGYRDPRVTLVTGFGAVEFTYGVRASNYDCVLAIDAGPGSSVLVEYRDTSEEATLDRSVGSCAEGCAQAGRAASMVVETARARAVG